MARHKVIVCCWKHGHETELGMTLRQEEKLAKQIPKMLAICPQCKKNEEGNQFIYIKEGVTPMGNGKQYRCRHGHITVAHPLKSKVVMIYGGGSEDFCNVLVSLQDFQKLIDNKQESCYHTKEDGKTCGCKLTATDDIPLSVPALHAIKTITRVGDIWDKNGVAPVTSGRHDSQGGYQKTRTEVANKARIEKMKRDRHIPKDAGPTSISVNKPTKRILPKRKSK